MDLKDTVVAITGGGSGLGAATARTFISAGAKVAIVDLPASPGAGLARELGSEALFAAANVTSESEVADAIERIKAKWRTLHVAVNCAGISNLRRIVTKQGPHSLRAFSRIIEVNLIGTFNMMRLAASQMASNEPNAEGERGVIVNTSSVAAVEGAIGQIAYAASKGGVMAMTLPAARDLASLGIRVCAIAPGIFDTPMFATVSEEAHQALESQIPFPRRLGRAEEFAALARHIVENPMLNGETIRLDGALRVPPR
jgi:3-hydroxyacyl-CoA dehydrogenase/3-hydroxy-2-methylbutyryl-CoA dehydrogenase